MSHQNAVDALNDLLAAEYESLIPRLAQADPYVSWPAADDRALIEQMLADVEAHKRDLTQLILKLRGSPVPPRYSTETGGLHYVQLSYLMPAVIQSVREMIAAYESAGPTGSAEADALNARHLADYRRYLTHLEKLHGGTEMVTSRG